MYLSTAILLSSFFFILFLTVLKRVQKYYREKPRLPQCIPSLPTLPIIGSLHHFLRDRDFVQFMRKWSSRLGPIFCTSLFGFPAVVLCDPNYIQKLLSSSDPGHLHRPEIHKKSLMPEFFHVGSLPGNGEVWKNFRLLVGKALGHESLKSFIPLINLHSSTMVRELKTLIVKEKGVITQMQDELLLTAMRINFHVITGATLRDDKFSQFSNDFHQMEGIVAKFVCSPWLAYPPFSWWFRKEKADTGKMAGNCERFLRKMLKECKNEEETESSFRSVMKTLVEHGVSDDHLISECFWLMFAGNNTVELTLLNTLFNLALSPEHQEKCREEADQIFLEVESKGRKMEMDDIHKLNYIERCIKESLRRVTTVPGSARQLQAPLRIDENIEISKGTIVIAYHDGAHINPNVFPNPEKFEPDRFLPENVSARHHYAFTPFSAGRRDCLGGKLAMLEMKVVLSWFLRHFEVSTMDNYDTVKFNYNIVVEPHKPIKFIMKERKFS